MDLSQTAGAEARSPQRPLEPRAITPADKRTHAAQEELRNLLAELQQVAENAIASSVDSTLNAAMLEAASTIDDLNWGKRPPAEQRACRECHYQCHCKSDSRCRLQRFRG